MQVYTMTHQISVSQNIIYLTPCLTLRVCPTISNWYRLWHHATFIRKASSPLPLQIGMNYNWSHWMFHPRWIFVSSEFLWLHMITSWTEHFDNLSIIISIMYECMCIYYLGVCSCILLCCISPMAVFHSKKSKIQSKKLTLVEWY